MKIAIGIALGLLVLWGVPAFFFRLRERRLRKPVKLKLGGDPLNRLDLPAIDLAEKTMDRVCLLYWTRDRMVWQFTQRSQEDIRTLSFRAVRGLALNQNPPVLVLESEDAAYGWQFRTVRRAWALAQQLTAAILAGAPDDVDKGVDVGKRVIPRLGGLAGQRERLVFRDDESGEAGDDD